MMIASCMTHGNQPAILSEVFNGESEFVFGPERNIVLVLGPTGSGASTLTSLLAGVELTAKDNRILDETHYIGSRTVVPHSMFDEINNIAYYDCPGFSDTKDVSADIAATFTFKKLLDFAENIKFVFTWPYSDDIDEFTESLKKICSYVSNFFINLKKYHNSIAFIVTNVPADKENNIGIKVLNIFQDIYNIYRIRLNESNIKLFRPPSKSGPLREMKSANEDRDAIINLIKNNLDYTSNEAKDFNVSITQESKLQINKAEMHLSLQNEFVERFNSTAFEIKRFFLEEEKQHSRNLQQSIHATKKINEKLLRVESTDLNEFKQQLIELVDDLEITIPSDDMSKTLKYIEFLSFINTFTDKRIIRAETIANLMTELKTYINDSLVWYNFLIELREKLCAEELHSYYHHSDEYLRFREDSIQQKVKSIRQAFDDGLTSYDIADENTTGRVIDFNIESKMNVLAPGLYAKIRNFSVNKFKLELLKAVWNQSTHKASMECLPDGTLLVKGYVVLLAAYYRSECFRKTRKVRAFALIKLHIPRIFGVSSDEKRNLDMAIISPVLETNDNTTLRSMGIHEDKSTYNRLLVISQSIQVPDNAKFDMQVAPCKNKNIRVRNLQAKEKLS